MPASGQQHATLANPYEEKKVRISEWTAKDIAAISSKLDKQLGPEYISSRAGPGGSRVHYLTAEKCIGLANEVFGFNGWSSSIQNIQVDFADENPQTQRVSIGLSVIVRITLRDGTYHEDIGYGSIDNAKSKAMAFEKAKKEGTTDGLKRALRSFGNVLGNCIYDQDYVKQVTKVKAQPVKRFHENNLHRHSDFVKSDVVKAEGQNVQVAVAPAKMDPTESFEDFLGELDEADFCVPGDGHPDEILLPVSNEKPSTNEPPGQTARVGTEANNARPPQTPNQAQSAVRYATGGQAAQAGRPHAGAQGRDSSHASVPGPPALAQQMGNPSEPVAFFSARTIKVDAEANPQGQGGNPIIAPGKQQLFNPKAESPSIRKTPGIDHSSSKPVARGGHHVAPISSQSAGVTTANGGGFTPLRQQGNGAQVPRGGTMNPSIDQARRIGAPGGPGSPLANRGSYRPPTIKRPLPGEANSGSLTRPPLTDITSNSHGATGTGPADSLDAKRQRTS